MASKTFIDLAVVAAGGAGPGLWYIDVLEGGLALVVLLVTLAAGIYRVKIARAEWKKMKSEKRRRMGGSW